MQSDRSVTVELTKADGTWLNQKHQDGVLRKRPHLQGPIDDAFMDSFVFVLPSGRSDDSVVQKWVEAESQHAMTHWRKHFRGDIRKVLDKDLTQQHIADSNIILFGDAKSNSVIADIIGKLPIEWDSDQIKIGNQSVASKSHVPIMIYPNPQNPDRYVVLNSGFTFREYDYLNNARQTAKLPDWALVDVTDGANFQDPGKIKSAGFFNEQWQ